MGIMKDMKTVRISESTVTDKFEQGRVKAMRRDCQQMANDERCTVRLVLAETGAVLEQWAPLG